MNDSTQPDAPDKKQALILVHGMGEQVPMETLRGFVETMWVHDPDINAHDSGDPPEQGNPVWWKPDPRTGSYELARVTTRAGHDEDGITGQRTDFYELYWADLTSANTLEQLKDWFMSLLWRWPSQVPKDVMLLWSLLWLLTIICAGLALWHGLAALGVPIPRWASISFAILAAFYALSIQAVLATFGDVARYIRAKPPNIAARQAVRERGLKLLRAVSGNGQYSRIVLVGHSLGSIIAYDLLKIFWSERETARSMTQDDALFRACEACQAAGMRLTADSPSLLENYRSAQQDVFKAMQVHDNPTDSWLISDFITLGSPLHHAQFLLARDEASLKIGRNERRFPICPPLSEGSDGFLYQPKRREEPSRWSAHHAAPFAAVRWTNIYDPATAIVLGDMIGGNVQPNFGLGIKDTSVTITRAWPSIFARLFTHTLYWTETVQFAPQIVALRNALDLAQKCKNKSEAKLQPEEPSA